MQLPATKFASTILLAGLFAILPAAPGLRAANLYVTTLGNVDEFTPGAVESTFATGLDDAAGFAFDSHGNLFVAIFGANDIIEFTPGGVETTFASGLDDPGALAFDSLGNLYETDYGTGDILKFTPGGVESVFATGLASPQGLAFDHSGNLYVAALGGPGLIKITPGGVESTFVSGLLGFSLTFDSSGNLFVGASGSSSDGIVKVTPGGVQSTFATGLSFPTGLAFDASGILYEANGGTNNIYTFTTAGARSTFASNVFGVQDVGFIPAPEPGSFALLLFGAAYFAFRARR